MDALPALPAAIFVHDDVPICIGDDLAHDEAVPAPIWTGDERCTIVLSPTLPLVLLPHDHS